MAAQALFADHVWLDLPGESPRLTAALVRWSGGRIDQVTPMARRQFEGSLASTNCLDLGGRLVTPSFINAHTHLSMSVFRGLGGDAARQGNVVEDLWFRIEGAQSPEDVRAFARMGALECLLAGQGAVYDHYYYAHAVALAMADTGLEGVVAETLQDLGGPFAHQWESSLQGAIALMDDGALAESGIESCLGPHATDTVSDALWTRILDLARSRDLAVHLHLAQSLEEVERGLSLGFGSPVQRLLHGDRLQGIRRVWLAHGMHVDDADRRALDPARDVIVHCPMAQTQFGFPADAAAWQRVGVPVVLGTDAGACNDGMDVQREMVLLAHGESYAATFAESTSAAREARRIEDARARAPFVAPEAALGAVWQRADGLGGRWRRGRVRPGYRASLAVWDLDHPAFWPGNDPLRTLAFGSPIGALHTSIVGGAVVGEVGDVRALLRRPEVDDWRREATERRAALLRGLV